MLIFLHLIIQLIIPSPGVRDIDQLSVVTLSSGCMGLMIHGEQSSDRAKEGPKVP